MSATSTRRHLALVPKLQELDAAERARYLDLAAEDLRARTGARIKVRRDGAAVRAIAAAILRAERAGASGART